MTWLSLALGAILALTLRHAVTLLRRPPSCDWCSSISGHPVTGHTEQQCAGQGKGEEQRKNLESRLKHEAQREAWEEHHPASPRNKAEADARRAARAGRARIVQVGTVTTRGNTIKCEGWAFDMVHGTQPSELSAANGQARRDLGRPEKVHGWTLDHLHAMAHGGSCACDVVRLARNIR